MIRKISSFFILFFFLFNIANASELNLYSERYVLYNMNDNKIIDEMKSHESVSIASLTKIMTVIVAIENIDDYDKKVIVKSEYVDDIAWDVAVAGFEAGDIVSVNDLLYGAMLPSGADAVQTLAYVVSGNREDFVTLMNDKVRELGLKNTHFDNVVGLYSKENYSSAYDMAQILIYSLKNKKFKEVFTTKEYTFTTGEDTKSTLSLHGKRIGKDTSFISGSKTGYISDAGQCLASTATLNGVDYLLVTLNAFNKEVSSPHVRDAITSYTYYDSNYSYKDIVSNDDVVVSLDTKYAKSEIYDVKANVEFEYYLKNNYDKKDITYTYDGIDELSYFTEDGSKLGKVSVSYKDEVIYEFDVFYGGELEFSLTNFLWINKIYVLIFVFVLFFLIKFVFRVKKKRK